MDVILNHRLVQASADVEGGGIIYDGGDRDPDAVRYAPAYCNDDLLLDRDFIIELWLHSFLVLVLYSVVIHALLTTSVAKHMLTQTTLSCES